MRHQNQMFTSTTAPTKELFSQLIPILTQANQILIEEYQRYCTGQQFYIEEKGDTSPVTQADLRVNTYLVNALHALTPHIPVLSEESDYSERHLWQTCWLLDPLDGTREFIAKRDQFTINLSLIQKHQTLFSLISVPCEQVIYMADDQHLPYKYDISQHKWLQYAPTLRQAKTHLNIATSHQSINPAYPKFMSYIEQFYPVRRIEAGSAYKFCMMLEGLIDIYPRFHPTAEWDTSAGQGLLEQIGGGLFALNQKPFLYNQRDTLLNNGFIAITDMNLYDLAFQALHSTHVYSN